MLTIISKLKMAAILGGVVAFSVLGYLYQSAASERDLLQKDFLASTQANKALAEWASDQVRSAERAAKVLTAHRNKAILTSKTIEQLRGRIQDAPASTCFDEPLPDTAINSLQWAVYSGRSSSSNNSRPSGAPASTAVSSHATRRGDLP